MIGHAAYGKMMNETARLLPRYRPRRSRLDSNQGKTLMRWLLFLILLTLSFAIVATTNPELIAFDV